MPKLDLSASVAEMRKDIVKLQLKKMINIDSYIVVFGENKGKYASNDILDWNDADVRHFYSEEIDKSVFDEYDKIIEKEKKESLNNAKKRKTIKENRPSAEDPEYLKKVEAIYEPGITKDERDAKLKEINEELEYRQLKYDSRYEALCGDKAARFEELDHKLSVRDYETHKDSIKGYQDQLEEATKKLKEYGVRKKPGAFTYAVNWFRRWFVDTDLKSIQEYDKYRSLVDAKNRIEGSISNAQITMESIQDQNEGFDYKENSFKNEERILNHARNIVVQNMKAVSKDEKFDVSNLDKEMVDSAAMVVMTDPHFKNTVKLLDAGNKEVNQNTFLNTYMTIKGNAYLNKVDEDEIQKDIQKIYSKSNNTEKIENPEKTNNVPTMGGR